MNEAQWAYLDSYVRGLADLLGLKEWRITLEREPCSSDDHAEIQAGMHHRRAYLKVAADFAALTAQERTETLVHELMHQHAYEIRAVIDTLQPVLGSGALFDTLVKQHIHAEEVMADRLGMALAPLVPPCDLPPSTGGANNGKTGRTLQPGLLHT